VSQLDTQGLNEHCSTVRPAGLQPSTPRGREPTSKLRPRGRVRERRHRSNRQYPDPLSEKHRMFHEPPAVLEHEWTRRWRRPSAFEVRDPWVARLFLMEPKRPSYSGPHIPRAALS
jgi:hypothetical protein